MEPWPQALQSLTKTALEQHFDPAVRAALLWRCSNQEPWQLLWQSSSDLQDFLASAEQQRAGVLIDFD